jgi:glycosyltransferase involved in cell wall biosynthesis
MALLSVVIITFNEERNIGRCLTSVKNIADDIVVVDSFSTDSTEAICTSFGVNFFKRPWDDYSSAKNFGTIQAQNNLILALDADEALSSELHHAITEIKATWIDEAYKFVRLTNYCGTWIRHGGWYPDVIARIFDRRKTQWHGRIHERLAGISKKDAELLRGDCYHYSYCSVNEHITKTKRFADLSARELFSLGRKASMMKLLFSPLVKFIRDYLLRLGFLDGRSGLCIAGISAYATFRKYASLRTLNKTGHEP